MLTGLPPFYDTNVQRMYHKILHEPLRFPKGENRQVCDSAKETLRVFLERRITDRLGTANGLEDVKNSPFFRSMDFDRVLAKEIPVEFVPPAASTSASAGETVQNFDTEFTSEKASFCVLIMYDYR